MYATVKKYMKDTERSSPSDPPEVDSLPEVAHPTESLVQAFFTQSYLLHSCPMQSLERMLTVAAFVAIYPSAPQMNGSPKSRMSVVTSVKREMAARPRNARTSDVSHPPVPTGRSLQCKGNAAPSALERIHVSLAVTNYVRV
ncbi:hypothetical protein MAR_006699 [Mya arenaria]|uniref:Uncharacterized protein n=1 Tax=Mya arenaria TaxID=6604 RepID=A0ABY7DDT3_MYAAR|nr:hypothetical protein MAR_006699 [Mya arenaria]